MLRRDTRRGALLGIVAMAAVGVIGPALVVLVFEHGSFDRAASRTTIGILLALVPGLLVGILHGYYGRALVAMDRAKVAGRFMVLYSALNLVFDAAAVDPLGAVGIALSTTASFAISALAQRRSLRRMLSDGGDYV